MGDWTCRDKSWRLIKERKRTTTSTRHAEPDPKNDELYAFRNFHSKNHWRNLTAETSPLWKTNSRESNWLWVPVKERIPEVTVHEGRLQVAINHYTALGLAWNPIKFHKWAQNTYVPWWWTARQQYSLGNYQSWHDEENPINQFENLQRSIHLRDQVPWWEWPRPHESRPRRRVFWVGHPRPLTQWINHWRVRKERK